MDVVVVGSCNMDLMSYIPQLPLKGQTIHGSKFTMGFGGKGANQCVMAAKLGGTCAMVAKVGNDSYGQSFMQEFSGMNINTDFVSATSSASTGVAPCLVDSDGNSAIIIISGANLLLTAQEVSAAEGLISSAKVVVCQLEIAEEATLQALQLAKKHKVTTIFNPAPRKANLNKEIYEYCDVFCPNETEVADTPVSSPSEAILAAQSYIELGCRTVIVTLGSQGCVMVDREDRGGRHIPCREVEAVDTTGAGDAFVGALAYFIATHNDLSMEEKIKRASYVASESVKKEGTQKSYPRREELPPALFL